MPIPAYVDLAQTFGPAQVLQDQPIGNTEMLLGPAFYHCQVAINKTSVNSVDAVSPGGVAGLYLQHLVDNSVATVSNVNCGARIMIQSAQRAVPGVVNDLVGTYVGVYSAGENVGGFGYHVDAYHAATGASVLYGMSAEMYRLSPAGITVGAHVRSISGAGMLTNDFAFLASNGGGAVGFRAAFKAGAQETGGVLTCDFGLDLREATCDKAALALPAKVLHPVSMPVGQFRGWLEVMAGDEAIMVPVWGKAKVVDAP